MNQGFASCGRRKNKRFTVATVIRKHLLNALFRCVYREVAVNRPHFLAQAKELARKAEWQIREVVFAFSSYHYRRMARMSIPAPAGVGLYHWEHHDITFVRHAGFPLNFNSDMGL
jgi:hypothetical protein